jgi:hypothetical protein
LEDVPELLPLRVTDAEGTGVPSAFETTFPVIISWANDVKPDPRNSKYRKIVICNFLTFILLSFGLFQKANYRGEVTERLKEC